MTIMNHPINRANVDAVLDAGQLYIAINNGRWYKARRNGATKLWKSDASRIRIPFKYGLKGYGSLDEHDFLAGELRSDWYRHVEDVPANLRP